MAILETLIILFKADTSNIKKGSEEATNESKKLNEQLGLLDKVSDAVGVKFLGIGKSISSIAAGYYSVKAIFEGLKSAINYDIELGKQSRFLGVAPEDLDAYDRAIKRVGGSTFDFENLLRRLSTAWKLNSSDVIKLIPQLADVLQKVNRFSAYNLIGPQYGLNEAQITFLRQGAKKIAEDVANQKKLGVVTQQNIDDTTKYNQEINDLSSSISKLYTKLAMPVLPYLIDFFHNLNIEIGKFNNNTTASNIFLDQMKKFGDFVKKNIINPSTNIVKENVGLIQDKVLDFSKGSRLHEILINNKSNKIFDLSLINESLNIGKKLLEQASITPLNYQTSSSILSSNSAFNRNTNINTGEITINTQANDAEGIAKELGKHINYQLGGANYNFANNVLA